AHENNSKLMTKVVDLEGRSRRQNLCILGLAELTEGACPTEFFSGLLSEVIGRDTLPSPPEIDRAQRSLAAKLSSGQRPLPGLKPSLLYPARLRIMLPTRRQEVAALGQRGTEICRQPARFIPSTTVDLTGCGRLRVSCQRLVLESLLLWQLWYCN
ncbi:hypothetical protein L3Q82_015940, partial [Scortum barcoo]